MALSISTLFANLGRSSPATAPSPPCLTAAVSMPAMAIPYPAVAYSTTLQFRAGHHFNVQVKPDEDEPEERLISRFRREVLKAEVFQECRRRRFFEDKRDKKKRKARDAATRNRKRKWQPRAPAQNKYEARNKRKDDDDEDDDNWELPDVDVPYC